MRGQKRDVLSCLLIDAATKENAGNLLHAEDYTREVDAQ
jgi:hypothetical protein